MHAHSDKKIKSCYSSNAKGDNLLVWPLTICKQKNDFFLNNAFFDLFQFKKKSYDQIFLVKC